MIWGRLVVHKTDLIDCYKHLNLSSLSSFWLFQTQGQFPSKAQCCHEWADLGAGQEWDSLAPGWSHRCGTPGVGGRQRLRTAAHPISKEALCQQISAGGGIMSSGVLRCPPYNLPLNAVLQSCFCGNLMMQLPCWITLSQVFPIIFFKMVKTEILCFCALCIPPVDTRSSELHHLKAEAFSLCIKRTKI